MEQMHFFNIKFVFYLAIFVQLTLQDSSHDYADYRFDNITKSPIDKRSYRGLILPNKMKVLLISDPTTHKSAASMNVGVGAFWEPTELPGLAHLCEHMVFKGSKKYPKENNFFTYTNQYGGSTNAHTRGHYTNYHFDINTENLEGALDRFAQFFLEPLFNETSIEREITIINSEFENQLKSDSERYNQVDKFSSDPNHPFNHFLNGNMESLMKIPKQKNIHVHKELLKFYKKWYSANIMSLSVLGKESLDDLEKMIVKLFSNVENRNTQVPKWTKYPFNEEHFQHKWFIVPLENFRQLILLFPLPDLNEYFQLAPADYLSYLLEYQGEGSLFSVLKKLNWINSIKSSGTTISKGSSLYYFSIDPTEEGLDHTDEIITLIFQYINMIKKQGPVKRIFNEYQSIKNLSFRFQEESEPNIYVQTIAQDLQKYPVEDVLIGPYLSAEWRPDLINKVIDCLTPEKIRIHILSQVYKNITTEVEPWFGAKFKKEKISASVIEKWNNAGINPDLQLPAADEFIPSRFNLKLETDKSDKFPKIIEETPLMRVWFKQDEEFLLPLANLTFHFISPCANSNTESYNNLHMFVKLIQDSLSEDTYSAGKAGIECDLTTTEFGIKLVIGGYNDKQITLLKKIMDKFINFKIHIKKFKNLKENYIQELKDHESVEPIELTVYYLKALLSKKFRANGDLLEASAKLTVTSLRNFIPKLFKKMFVECLIHGNVRAHEALKISSFVQLQLKTINKSKGNRNIIPLLPKKLGLIQTVNLNQGYNYLYEVQNSFHEISATAVYYQIGLESTKYNMLLALFLQIIYEPSFDVLRTVEQLGYTVVRKVIQVNEVRGLIVIIQGKKHPQYIEGRIDAFMKSMKNFIKNMSDEEFSKHKESVAVRISEKPITMAKMSDHFWNKISSQVYNFNTTKIEVAYLRTITKDQILEFYEEFIKNDLGSVKKLSVHVISTANGGLSNKTVVKESDKTKPISILNIHTFQRSQSFYPNQPKFHNVPKQFYFDDIFGN